MALPLVTPTRNTTTFRVQVDVDVTDLVANTTASKRDKVVTSLQRCQAALADFIVAQDGTTAIDTQIAALTAQKAAMPAPVASF
jgi:hypothetical protein